MPRNRFVDPAVDILPLSDGDTVTVKRRLSHGDKTDMYARMYREGVDGALSLNPGAVGMATVLAYLLDWTFVDGQGHKVAIEGRAPADVEAVLRALDPDDFAEVRAAIEAHEDRITAARDAQKKMLGGSPSADPTSRSPSVPAGASSGSAI